MDVFLTWSGDRSLKVAELLSRWLPQVIQALEPFVSTSIEKGRRWTAEIADRLAKAPVGIVCLTRDNREAPWLLFEAGVMARPRDGNVCTLLLDLEPADVEPPLGDFQHTKAEKVDVRRLLHDLNRTLERRGERPVDDAVLERVFERNWPEFEAEIEKLRVTPTRDEASLPLRSDRALLEEILGTVRRWSSAVLGDLDLGSRLGVLASTSRPAVSRDSKIVTIRYLLTTTPLTAEPLAAFLDSLRNIEGHIYTTAAAGPDCTQVTTIFLRAVESEISTLAASVGVTVKDLVVTSSVIERPEEVIEWPIRTIEDELSDRDLKKLRYFGSKPRRVAGDRAAATGDS